MKHELEEFAELEQMISEAGDDMPLELDGPLQAPFDALRMRLEAAPRKTYNASRWARVLAALRRWPARQPLFAYGTCATMIMLGFSYAFWREPYVRSKVSRTSADTRSLASAISAYYPEMSQAASPEQLALLGDNLDGTWFSNDYAAHAVQREAELAPGAAAAGPVVSNVPDVVIGDAEGGAGNNKFVFPEAANLQELVKDDDKAKTVAKIQAPASRRGSGAQGNSGRENGARELNFSMGPDANPGKPKEFYGYYNRGDFDNDGDTDVVRVPGLQNTNGPALPKQQAGVQQQVAPQPAAVRQIIYTADLGLRVADVAAAMVSIKQLIGQYHGFIAHATLTDITFRVPPSRFDAALDALAKLGEVSSRNVQSADVTAQYRDIGLRIDVAKGSRKRLMELLARTGAIKDVLEVERDIRRLTEEIEQLEGQHRVLDDQVELATITVTLNQKATVQETPVPHAESQFDWIRALGGDRALWRVSDKAPVSDQRGWWKRTLNNWPYSLGVSSGQILPAGFVPLLYTESMLVGTTPENHRLRLLRWETRQYGTLDYWAHAVADELVNNRGYKGAKPEAFALADKNLSAVVLRCELTLNDKPWLYELWLVQKRGDSKVLCAVEYMRAKSAAPETLMSVEESVKGLRLN